MTTWTTSHEIAADLDSRCHRDVRTSPQIPARIDYGALVEEHDGSRRNGVYCKDISLELEQVRHVRPSTASLPFLLNWWQ